MKRLPAEQQNQAPGSLRPPGARAASLTRGPRGLPARPLPQSRSDPAVKDPPQRCVPQRPAPLPSASPLPSVRCVLNPRPAPRVATSLHTRPSNARDRPPPRRSPTSDVARLFPFGHSGAFDLHFLSN